MLLPVLGAFDPKTGKNTNGQESFNDGWRFYPQSTFASGETPRSLFTFGRERYGKSARSCHVNLG